MVVAKADSQTQARLKKLGNRWWRLNNLYWIIDEQGEKVLFQPNAVQKALYLVLWWLNIIPKSRQHGITTFISIFMLDACLFNSNVRAGIIAHKLADAKKIFRDKIRFAYSHLPDDLKAARTLVKDDSQEIVFSNNSGIYVGTSMRSGTLQYLHVSEYGWLTIHAPMKAAEIKAGALETLHADSMVFIESTSEGPFGDFKEMCDEALLAQGSGKELGPLDWKLHAFYWHDKPTNITDPLYVEPADDLCEYFDKLEVIFKKAITPGQRAWYTAKKRTLKHLMYKEHPSTYEEFFIASVEGAYFAQDIAEMREFGRIGKVPHDPRYPVHTVCDLGLGANMPWIFWQEVGLEVHVIDCFCLDDRSDTRGGAAFFKRMLSAKVDELRYDYGVQFAPFDVIRGQLGDGRPVIEVFREHGIDFYRLDREHRVLDGIERMTNMFPKLYIDAVRCEKLIMAWSSYHREWIDRLDSYGVDPVKDKSSHFADAGRYMSMVIDKGLTRGTGVSDEEWEALDEMHSGVWVR